MFRNMMQAKIDRLVIALNQIATMPVTIHNSKHVAFDMKMIAEDVIKREDLHVVRTEVK